jgi:hypothetical protein
MLPPKSSKVVRMRLLLVTLCHSLVFAQGSIVVKDTSGFTRAEESISSQFGSIEFSVLNELGNPSEGATITLTSEATGEVVETVSVGGKATFNNILPGVYVVSSSEVGLTFTTVSIMGGASGISFWPATAGALGIGGATVGIIELTDDDKNTVMSPSS